MGEQRVVYSVDARDMPEFSGMEHEVLLEECRKQWFRAEHAIGKLKNAEDELVNVTAERNASRRELKLVSGSLSNQLHNQEVQKAKLERMKAELEHRKQELDLRDSMAPDEAWAAKLAEADERAERFKAQRDEMKEAVGELKAKLGEIAKIAW